MTPKTCLVTGAGRGIGAAVARRLSAGGHRVALVARTEPELTAVADELPGPALALPADVTASDAADTVLTRVEREWGPVEVLVLAAGVGSSAPIARTTDEQWRDAIEVNLTAPFRFLRAAVPAMVSRGWG
ncbi:MAG: SDR family NAD(P)-dependent oxidoreductase, partial [Pseudonocardia sp.]|nr:SDR family NAD(P)-dependent oxidoreductase [Pseudonocardia sp.]